jgi:hypothetical protein
MENNDYSESIETYLFQNEIDYLNRFALPKFIYYLNSEEVYEDKSKIDILIEIARLHHTEFIPHHSAYFRYAYQNISIITLLISKGHLDKEYFSNTVVNGEKLKLITACLEDKVDFFYKEHHDLDDKGIKKTIVNNIKAIVFYLCRYNRDSIKSKFSAIEFEIKELEAPLDKRVSDKAPSNVLRIKALKEFCPELWDRLSKSQSKELQKEVVHLITGVNKTDAYKYSFGDRQKQPINLNAPVLSSLLDQLK